jgi:hypothetical protein
VSSVAEHSNVATSKRSKATVRRGLLMGFRAVLAFWKGWKLANRKSTLATRLSLLRLGQVDGEDDRRRCFEHISIGTRYREVKLGMTQEGRDHRRSGSLLGRPAIEETGEPLTRDPGKASHLSEADDLDHLADDLSVDGGDRRRGHRAPINRLRLIGPNDAGLALDEVRTFATDQVDDRQALSRDTGEETTCSPRALAVRGQGTWFDSLAPFADDVVDAFRHECRPVDADSAQVEQRSSGRSVSPSPVEVRPRLRIGVEQGDGSPSRLIVAFYRRECDPTCVGGSEDSSPADEQEDFAVVTVLVIVGLAIVAGLVWFRNRRSASNTAGTVARLSCGHEAQLPEGSVASGITITAAWCPICGCQSIVEHCD